ncbi:glutaredoxin 3 [Marinicellulosiphila megalodicopiae]|uniref:glutaredoxin 3 n=1 Tax=Marinicellulosiphila megalodicopiae TaxID=2724896 RepID=UPI003BAEF681
MVTIYTTRFCPFCIRAKQLLEKKGAKYDEIKVDQDYALRREMMSKSGRHTVPQIWIGEKHIGGCDELYQLENQNELDQLLKG